MNALVERLEAQGIELYTNDKPITVAAATTQLGEQANDLEIPAGSLIVPNRQPDAPLVAAILEFDADVKKSVLIEERQRTLRDGSSLMYDTTAWNFSMMYGLPSITVPQHLSKGLSPWESHSGTQSIDETALAWAVKWAEDDRSVAFAARLMEQGINVRIIDKATVLSDQALPRGTVVVTAMDNPKRDDVVALVSAEAKTLDVDLVSVGSGYGAVICLTGAARTSDCYHARKSRSSASRALAVTTSARAGGPSTHTSVFATARSIPPICRVQIWGDSYNTIVIPNGYRPMSSAETSALRDWVKQGGTLIAHDNSAAQLARDNGIGQVRSIGDALDNAQDYDIALQRERLSTSDDSTPPPLVHTASVVPSITRGIRVPKPSLATN